MELYGYDVLARDYYDSSHVTSRNFDYTTEAVLAEHPVNLPDKGLVLEVGCGRGRSNEYLGIQVQRIIQLDSSGQMLALKDRELSTLRVHSDAAAVPISDGQFISVVGFLIDPFIGLNFFSEAYRLLQSAGLLFATTPSAEWGHTLRDVLEIEASYARFVTKDGDTVIVPSTLIPVDQLSDMLKHSGFQDVSITSHCLPRDTNPISPDIQRVADTKKIEVHDLPVIQFITATKP